MSPRSHAAVPRRPHAPSARLRRHRARRLRLEHLELRRVLAADPVGGQFLIDTVNPPPEPVTAVAVVDTSPIDGGSFVSVWQSVGEDGDGFGIFARAFTAAGDPLGAGPVQVNVADLDAIATGNQTAPTIASDGQGGLVIAWQSEDQAAGGYDIAYRIGSVDAAGTFTFSAEGRANTAFVSGDQIAPAAAMAASGDFVISWQSDTGDETAGTDIHFKRGTLAGIDGGPEQVVNSATAGDQLAPAAAMNPATGDFVIVWQGPDTTDLTALAAEAEAEEDATGVFLKAFRAGGGDSGDVRANAGIFNDPGAADVALASDNTIAAVWQVEGQQGSGSDVFLRRLAFDRDTLAVTGLSTAGESDVRLNQTTAKPQRAPSVGIDDDGDLFTVWQSQEQDGFSWGIFGRRYDAGGDAFGDEFLVNVDQTEGPQTAPDVAVAPTGRSVAAWIGSLIPAGGEEGEGGRLPAVRGRIFEDAGAVPVGGEQLLATFVGLEEQPAATAANAAGNFVVVWQTWEDDGSDFGIRARLFQADGQPAAVAGSTAALAVNTFTVGSQSTPAVAMDAAGNFVAVWQSSRQDGSGTGIYARRYDASLQGWADETEFLVTETVAGDQQTPAVGMDGFGNFTVVWAADDGDGSGIFARRFAADGTPLGGEFQVNVQSATDQVGPVIGMNQAGEALVAWVSDHGSLIDPDDGEKTVYARWFYADGTPLGSEEFSVSNYVKDAQEQPAVGLDAAGNVAITWQSINQESNLEGEGSSWGVYARQFVVDKAAGTISSPQAEEFRVNEETEGPQRYPTIGVADAGQFVVGWQSINQDGSSWGVYQRQYLPDGTPAGGERRVNTATSGPQVLPVIAQRGSGDFSVIWSGRGFDELEGNWGQRYAWIADDFNRPDAPTLGPAWTNRIGGFGVVSGRAAVTTPLGLTTFNGVAAANVAVEGLVTLGGGTTAYQGLFARYGGPGDRNMYVGSLVRDAAGFSGKIWRNLGGRWTLLASGPAAAGAGALRFEAFGNSLKLFLDGELVVAANDGSIPGAGGIGMRGSQGTTVEDFTFAKLEEITPQRSPLAFRDFFDSSRDGSQLSRFWDNDAGMFIMAEGAAIPSATAASVASLNGVQVRDVSVRADVALEATAGTSYVGLMARYGGPGDSTMYVGSLVQDAAGFSGKIWRNLSGRWRLLAQAAAPAGAGSLQFDAIGNVLTLSLDGRTLATASDSAIAAGSVGLRASGPEVAIDQFEAYGDGLPPPYDVTLPFADDFEQPGIVLSGAWTQQQGVFIRTAGAAQPIGTAVALATLNGVAVADVSLTADVSLGSASFSFIGLAARSSGPGDTNQYVGSLVRDAAGLTGKIWRNVAGTWTLLGEGPAPAAGGILRFDLLGSSLSLSLDGTPVATATDAAIAGPGRVGLRGLGPDVRVEDFAAA